jgi:hypothetical protein
MKDRIRFFSLKRIAKFLRNFRKKFMRQDMKRGSLEPLFISSYHTINRHFIQYNESK